jgi:hypothetical protein
MRIGVFMPRSIRSGLDSPISAGAFCAGESIGGAEKALGWPSRSGKLVLGPSSIGWHDLWNAMTIIRDRRKALIAQRGRLLSERLYLFRRRQPAILLPPFRCWRVEPCGQRGEARIVSCEQAAVGKVGFDLRHFPLISSSGGGASQDRWSR